MSNRRSPAGRTFLIVWLVGWSAGTLFFDGYTARSIARQLQSRAYSMTAGIITRSDIKVSRDSEGGTSHSLVLEYTYEVNGVSYQGQRYRYGIETSGKHDVQRIVGQFPVDSKIDVYYDPADPQEAVLAPGIGWMDLFMPLFLLPFNLVMFGMVSFLAGGPLRRWLGRPPATIKIRQHGMTWSVKTYAFTPLAAAGATALAVSFVSVFVVAFGSIVTSGWVLVIAAWCCIALLALAAFLGTRPQARFEIDEYQQRITLSRDKNTAVTTLDRSEIESIGTDDSTVELKADKAIKIPCGSQANAEWLADWLRERLGEHA